MASLDSNSVWFTAKIRFVTDKTNLQIASNRSTSVTDLQWYAFEAQVRS